MGLHVRPDGCGRDVSQATSCVVHQCRYLVHHIDHCVLPGASAFFNELIWSPYSLLWVQGVQGLLLCSASIGFCRFRRHCCLLVCCILQGALLS